MASKWQIIIKQPYHPRPVHLTIKQHMHGRQIAGLHDYLVEIAIQSSYIMYNVQVWVSGSPSCMGVPAYADGNSR